MPEVYIADADIDKGVRADTRGEEYIDCGPIPPFGPPVTLWLLHEAPKLCVCIWVFDGLVFLQQRQADLLHVAALRTEAEENPQTP